MILGITGGTGCGKTTLLNCITVRGGLLLDCDAIYHELLKTDKALNTAIEARFPGTYEDGILNRKKLGAIVFSDSGSLLDLNAITHAAICQEVTRRLETRPALAAIDAVALFESGLSRLCDITIAVTAPEADRIQRLIQRDGITEQYARSRIAAQPSPEWFAQRADYVLENNDTFEAFERKCAEFVDSLNISAQERIGHHF